MVRVFRTKGFGKGASKAGITDEDLCKAAKELDQGLGDNLGGNVWKKRLNENRSRSIVATKPKQFWVFVYFFDKSDRDNIDSDELAALRKLAGDYGKSGLAGMNDLVAAASIVEICHDRKTK